MADLSSKKSNFISRCAQAAEALKAARETLLVLASEYSVLNYGSVLQNSDFVGDNAYMTAANIVALMVSQGNLETFWGAGNGTNIDSCTP